MTAPERAHRDRPSRGVGIHSRAWLSEVAGTAVLLFVSVLLTRWLFGPRSALADAGLPARLAIAGAITGALITLLIISPLGTSSGGHFNPAVSATLWLLRALPGRDAAAYVAAQLAGSVIGVTLGRLVLGPVASVPSVDYATIHAALGWSDIAVFAGEAASLAILMAFVIAFLGRPTLLAWTPMAVGAAVGVLIFAGGLTSGGSFNPARQLGPVVVGGEWIAAWPYMVGPMAGAAGVALLHRCFAIHPPLTCALCGDR